MTQSQLHIRHPQLLVLPEVPAQLLPHAAGAQHQKQSTTARHAVKSCALDISSTCTKPSAHSFSAPSGF